MPEGWRLSLTTGSKIKGKVGRRQKKNKQLIESLESLGNTSVYYPVKQTRPNGAKLRQRHIILHTQSPSS